MGKSEVEALIEQHGSHERASLALAHERNVALNRIADSFEVVAKLADAAMEEIASKDREHPRGVRSSFSNVGPKESPPTSPPG